MFEVWFITFLVFFLLNASMILGYLKDRYPGEENLLDARRQAYIVGLCTALLGPGAAIFTLIIYFFFVDKAKAGLRLW